MRATLNGLLHAVYRWSIAKHLLALLVLTAILLPSFSENVIRTAENGFFNSWQQGSEGIVLREITAAASGSPWDIWGLDGRQQQLGAQGHFFSSISLFIGLENSYLLNRFSALLTAFTVSALVVIFLRKGQFLLGTMLFVSAFLSPWFVAAARNLYWVPWTWIMPLIFASLLESARNRATYWLLHFALFLTFVFRFASGYEFMTSIILSAALVPVFLKFRQVMHQPAVKTLQENWRVVASVFSNGLLSFVATLTVHAGFRGNGSVLQGFLAIWTQDVLRRTYGDPADFDESYFDSLNAKPWDPVITYIFEWGTDFLSLRLAPEVSWGLGSSGLWLAIAGSAVLVVAYFYRHGSFPTGAILLLGISILPPLSWYVLAKGHSVIHTHINFVLWYPLTSAVVLAVLLTLAGEIFKSKT